MQTADNSEAGDTSSQRGPPRERSVYVAISVSLCAFACITVLTTAFVYWRGIGDFSHQLTDKPEDWAYLGEYFGGITSPLVSLLALIALAITLRLQDRQLQQVKADAASLRITADRQAFEGTLFQMLKQFAELARGNHWLDTKSEQLTGLRYFDVLVDELRKAFNRRIILVGAADELDFRLTPQFYGRLYDIHQGELGPYFRNLFHIYKFIDGSDRSNDDKVSYANLVRAQLSANETVLLFYNGIWGEGRNFRQFIQKYGILKHVVARKLLNPQHITRRDWYEVSAFQNAADRKSNRSTPSVTNARNDFDSDLDFEEV